MSFCDWLWVMHNSSMLENQSGLHQGTKMCITAEDFPSMLPFCQAQPQKLVQLRRRVIEQLWWVPGIQPGSAHYSVLWWCSRYNLHSAKVYHKHHSLQLQENPSYLRETLVKQWKKKIKIQRGRRNPQTKVTLGSGPGLGSISWSRDPGLVLGCPDPQERDFWRAWESLSAMSCLAAFGRYKKLTRALLSSFSGW